MSTDREGSDCRIALINIATDMGPEPLCRPTHEPHNQLYFCSPRNTGAQMVKLGREAMEEVEDEEGGRKDDYKQKHTRNTCTDKNFKVLISEALKGTARGQPKFRHRLS